MQEFDPIEHILQFLRWWWLLLAAALLGGTAGFLFSRAHPPVYEATATFPVQIDLKQVPEEEMDFYYIDLALETTETALTTNEVLDAVFIEAARLGEDTSRWDLLANTTIERRHAFYDLRIRHTDPTFARSLVNLWVELGYQAMLELKAQGIAPAYVIFAPPMLAHTPVQPVYYTTNKLVLAGSLVGWVLGLLFVEFNGKRKPFPRRS